MSTVDVCMGFAVRALMCVHVWIAEPQVAAED